MVSHKDSKDELLHLFNRKRKKAQLRTKEEGKILSR